jgi:transcriptional regulator with XRE-family HTH domain
MPRDPIVRLPELGTSYLEGLRLDRGWSIQEAARRANVDVLTVRRLELMGAKRPIPRTLRAFSLIYGVPVVRINDEICAWRARYERATGKAHGRAA